MRKFLIALVPFLFTSSLYAKADVNLPPNLLFKTTHTWTASQTFIDSATFLQPITVPSCNGCGGGSGGGSDNLGSHVATNTLQMGVGYSGGFSIVGSSQIIVGASSGSLAAVYISSFAGPSQVVSSSFPLIVIATSPNSSMFRMDPTSASFGTPLIVASSMTALNKIFIKGNSTEPSLRWLGTGVGSGAGGTGFNDPLGGFDEIDIFVAGTAQGAIVAGAWNINSGSKINNSNGTVSLPSYAFSNRTSAGLFLASSGNSDVQISNNRALQRWMVGGGVLIGSDKGYSGATLEVSSPPTIAGAVSPSANNACLLISTGPGPATKLLEVTGATSTIFNTLFVFPSSGNYMGNPSTYSIAVASAVPFNGALPVAPFAFAVTTTSHINSNGTSPTLTSCGSSPSVFGSDNAFTISPGATAGGCTATFAQPFNNTPTCQVEEETFSLVNALAYTVTNVAVTVTQTSLTSKLDVMCLGHD